MTMSIARSLAVRHMSKLRMAGRSVNLPSMVIVISRQISTIRSGVMNLAEGQVDYDQLTDEQVTEIPEQEFEAVWDAVLATHDTVWRRSQMRYPIGRPVQGALLIFYPQGVVIQLDQETVGIADYAACRASTAPENMYPRHKVSATVAGYDERQHWIKLDLPQVHAESIN
jgi:hypothetical protein